MNILRPAGNVSSPAVQLDGKPLVMGRGIVGEKRDKTGRKVMSSTRYSFTYLGSAVGQKKARGGRAGSGRGMVHSGVRPAAFRGPRVGSPQLNRPPPPTCSTSTWPGLIWGPRRATSGPGEPSDGGDGVRGVRWVASSTAGPRGRQLFSLAGSRPPALRCPAGPARAGRASQLHQG